MSAGDRFALLAVGVGGQGVMTATRLLGEAALLSGLEAMVGQLHGMSQRGGSVESTLVIGPAVHSSFVECADAILGLEPLEVLRARSRMSAHTRIVMNTSPIVPFTLTQKGLPYPELAQILADLRDVCPNVVAFEGGSLAIQAGSARALNAVMLGALAATGCLPFPEETLWRTIEARSPAAHRQTNRSAFALGKKVVTA